jgi:hypothetical protein
MVEITILKDPSKKAIKDNTKKKEFPTIYTFRGCKGATSGAFILEILKMEVFSILVHPITMLMCLNIWIPCCMSQLAVQETSWLTSLVKRGTRQQFANVFAVCASTNGAFKREMKAYKQHRHTTYYFSRLDLLYMVGYTTASSNTKYHWDHNCCQLYETNKSFIKECSHTT